MCVTFGLYYTKVQENKAFSLRYDNLRKTYADLSCKCNGIGPTGGFCLDKSKFKVGGNNMWCKNVAKEFRHLFHGQSVYDFGAGLGFYGKALMAEDNDSYRVASYKAFDGAENLDSVFPDGFVEYLDLSKPVYLKPRDWVLSLEVGEHIPVEYERTFIENLHRHNKKGIVLSWAIEGNLVYHSFLIIK
jgi:tryptophanyl-tRNA synthetase